MSGSNTEICSKCGRSIGAAETPHVWQQSIVCRECYDQLKGQAPKGGVWRRLIGTSARAYCGARAEGKSHVEAMDHLIESRYPLSEEDRRAVKGAFEDHRRNRERTAEGGEDNLTEVTTLVEAVYRHEYSRYSSGGWHPEPPEERPALLCYISNTIQQTAATEFGLSRGDLG